MSFPHTIIHNIWQQQNAWARVGRVALTPFSFFFSVAVHTRNWLYDCGVLPITQVPLNVISVGNLTVGGTGKTPLVLWLAETLQQRGYQVGILSRGYKGTAIGSTLVGREGIPLVTPVEVGDEAVMLARRFAGVVIAGRDRIAAARLAYQQLALDVVILDDGFQHRRLHRDIDILLLSAQETNNTNLLPAGPFREPLSSIRRAHAVVLSKKIVGSGHSLPFPFSVTPHSAFRIPHSTSSHSAIPQFHADLVPTALVQVVDEAWHELPLSTLAGKRLLVFTGIANPQPFYRTIQQLGAELAQVVEFPDHHSYTHTQWQKLTRDSRAYDGLLTTEKDLVKLERFSVANDRLLALRVQLQLEPAEMFVQTIERRLRIPKKDRTDHGRTISH